MQSMQSMQRQFGKLTHKAPGDNAKVSVVLNDYEDADNVLAKIIENAKSWRDSWVALTTSQLGIVTEYEGLYDPIEGTGRTNMRSTTATPELQLHRTFELKEAYAGLKNELLEELGQIENSIVIPATTARDCLAPLKKTIKKRENRRLDYEKAQDKALKLQRKPGKSAKDDAALAKAQEEVARVTDEFQVIDNHVRETLPPIVNAAFSIVPPLVSAVVLIQNRLLGLYYTVLHNYCETHNFPSPPPPMDGVIISWQEVFNPARKEIESISCIAHGKAARQPMNVNIEAQAEENRKPSTSSTNGFRRTSSNLIPPKDDGPGPIPPRPTRISSTPTISTPRPTPGPRPTFNNPNFGSSSNLGVPTEFTTASGFGHSPPAPAYSPNSLKPRNDYFSTRPPSAASTAPSTISTNSVSPGIVKKIPPPPPPKRIASNKLPEEFVVALYPFAGQSAGDLSFQEGDRIKVVKKTGTDQDWWVGEIGGRKGSFPANYCKTG
ncbi:SH3 domain-containing protein [Seiridium cupressi]